MSSEELAKPALEAADEAEAVAAERGKLCGLRAWIVRHDESWLFMFGYVTAAVVLSIWISLFWLVVVVGVHLVFEWVRQHHHDPRWPGLGQRLAWELKLDLGLIVFALALAVYMEVILGLAGLGGAARLGAQGGARLAGWARALRGVLLSVDDAVQVARAFLGKAGRQRPEAKQQARDPFDPHPWRRWGTGDHLAIWLALSCLVLILLAPLLLEHHSYASVWQTMLDELHPLPATGH